MFHMNRKEIKFEIKSSLMNDFLIQPKSKINKTTPLSVQGQGSDGSERAGCSSL